MDRRRWEQIKHRVAEVVQGIELDSIVFSAQGGQETGAGQSGFVFVSTTRYLLSPDYVLPSASP